MNKTLRISPHLRLQHKEAATSILTGRHLQNITTLFRAVEFLLFLVAISRLSLVLPPALKLSSGDYFRELAVALANPRFGFVVGNAIVITLFLQSGGKLFHPDHAPDSYAAGALTGAAAQPRTTFIVSIHSSGENAGDGKSSGAAEVKINCYRRSKSEKVYYVKPEGERKSGGGGAVVLRRTKTEKLERRVACTCRGHYPEDHMSNEEFRRTIEDFIARQQRTLREEDEEEILAVAG